MKSLAPSTITPNYSTKVVIIVSKLDELEILYATARRLIRLLQKCENKRIISVVQKSVAALDAEMLEVKNAGN